MPCPYMPCPNIIGGGVMGNHQNAMNMVRHDDECIQLDMREMVRYVRPTLVCDVTRLVQTHFPRHHLAEQTRAVVDADGDKICPRLRVIISGQANAAAVVLFRVVGHGYTLLAFSSRARTNSMTASCIAKPHLFIGVSAGAVGVFAVQTPAHGVGDDVFANAVQGVFGADDVFVIVALPDGLNVGILSEPFGHPDFESANHRTDGFRCAPRVMVVRRWL